MVISNIAAFFSVNIGTGDKIVVNMKKGFNVTSFCMYMYMLMLMSMPNVCHKTPKHGPLTHDNWLLGHLQILNFACFTYQS